MSGWQSRCWVALSVLSLSVSTALGQTALGSAFTYQGKASESGEPLNGNADFQFTLWDAPTAGNQIGVMSAVNNVAVQDGLFTVSIDFGTTAFNGDARWVELAVRSPAGVGPFTTLSPRQPLTAAPYARFSTAPWATSANSIFNVNSGNVGIGTSAPSNKLSVVGSANVTGNVGIGVSNPSAPLSFGNVLDDLIVLNGTAGGPNFGIGIAPSQLRIHTAVGTQDIAFGHGYSGAFTERMRVRGNGTVGIGTPSPGATLDVVGLSPFPHLRVAARDDASTPFGAFISLDASPVSGGKNWLMYATSDAAGEGAGKLIFRNYTDNAQGVTFDPAGMVGIGTYTPYAQLHVAGGPSMNQVRVDSADAGGTWLNLANSTENSTQWSFVSTGAGSPEGPGKLLIRDQLAESTRVVVDSAGRVGVGTDATAASLTVGGNGSMRFVNSLDPLAYYQGSLYFGNGTGTYIAGDDSTLYMTNGRVFVGVNDAFFVECQPGEWAHLFRNAVQGSYLGGMTISNDGYLYLTNRAYGASGYARLDSTGNWSVASDRRMKRDIQPLDGLLDKTLALRPVSYFYNNQDMAQTPHRQLGFIAQDVEPLFPSLVLGDEQKSLNYSGLSVVAIGALQELKREKDAEIAALQAENAKLKARLDAIEAALVQLGANDK